MTTEEEKAKDAKILAKLEKDLDVDALIVIGVGKIDEKEKVIGYVHGRKLDLTHSLTHALEAEEEFMEIVEEALAVAKVKKANAEHKEIKVDVTNLRRKSYES